MKWPALEREACQPKERLREVFAAADVFVVSLNRGPAGYIVPSKLIRLTGLAQVYTARDIPWRQKFGVWKLTGYRLMTPRELLARQAVLEGLTAERRRGGVCATGFEGSAVPYAGQRQGMMVALVRRTAHGPNQC